ncbi:hypothetical protein AFLA_011934 [Aspergillus flavus NRRL3357]|nr:hypothetical protein AFLA_011934 [Aspergillus flavus NRRL3357]
MSQDGGREQDLLSYDSLFSPSSSPFPMQCDELIIILSAALSGLLKLESRKKRKNKINYEDIAVGRV